MKSWIVTFRLFSATAAWAKATTIAELDDNPAPIGMSPPTAPQHVMSRSLDMRHQCTDLP